MKTLLLPVLLLLLASPSPAAVLSEATPEQFADWQTNQWISFIFFDSARTVPSSIPDYITPGWASRFGRLNGGDTFDTDLITDGDQSSPNVWWDFGESGYEMRWILLETWPEGVSENRLYFVPHDFGPSSDGPLQVSLASGHAIYQMAFYGFDPTYHRAPESSPGIAALAGLFGLGLLAKKRIRRR